MSRLAWTFRVWPVSAGGQGEFFELGVVELDAATLRVVMLENHRHPAISAKGIPDAMLIEARRVLGRTIQSSPTRGTTHDIRRSKDATKVWERLRANGLASYDSSADVYYLV